MTDENKNPETGDQRPFSRLRSGAVAGGRTYPEGREGRDGDRTRVPVDPSRPDPDPEEVAKGVAAIAAVWPDYFKGVKTAADLDFAELVVKLVIGAVDDVRAERFFRKYVGGSK